MIRSLKLFVLWMSLVTGFVFLANPQQSFARRDWPGRKFNRAWSVDLVLGPRYWAHYNRVRVISTPPESFMAEAQFLFWYKGTVAISLFGSTKIAKSSATFFGAGIRLPFLTFTGNASSLISAVSLLINADFFYYTIQPAEVEGAYKSSGFSYRGGGSIHWKFGKGKFYLDTTMAIGNFNGNFFIGPFIGVGFQF